MGGPGEQAARQDGQGTSCCVRKEDRNVRGYIGVYICNDVPVITHVNAKIA